MSVFHELHTALLRELEEHHQSVGSHHAVELLLEKRAISNHDELRSFLKEYGELAASEISDLADASAAAFLTGFVLGLDYTSQVRTGEVTPVI